MDNRADLAKQAEELGIAVDRRWGESRLRKEIEAAQAKPTEGSHEAPTVEPAPTVPVEIPAQAANLAPLKRDIPPLADYIRDVEGRHASRDVYAVEVSHPDGEERVYPGTYSGIRIKRGTLSVRYSDGTRE